MYVQSHQPGELNNISLAAHNANTNLIHNKQSHQLGGLLGKSANRFSGCYSAKRSNRQS